MKDIIIDYKLRTDNSWKSVVISPEDYLDKDDSGFSIDSIEKFFLEPRDYISVEKSEIVFLNFDKSDDLGNRRLTKFTYWKDGRNQIQDHYEYLNEKLTYRTIIQSVELTNGEILILRLEEINGQLVPITHSIMDSEEQFTQTNDLSVFRDFRVNF
ncbi:MAG: hypothetical protein IM631_00020 [Cytophagales bacterium]|nr:hypothetical protein [Cytophagales bacterium]MCA6369752.1 hypothetical protein [Cytophagales bacterium]MCA6377282.1 hypothetical protein [Cytophagales bacterium]MCA6386086.1 hypothetical protein [Cytophagales bacterium]